MFSDAKFEDIEMGTVLGFDLFPRLSTGGVDQYIWQSFIDMIKKRFQEDDLVEIKHSYIAFDAGEHPMLPFEGHKFMRFSSKISGNHAGRVFDWLITITDIAFEHFSAQIKTWNSAAGQSGIYTWDEVHASIKTLMQPDEPEPPITIAQSMAGIDPTHHDLDAPLSQIQTIPGKGLGLIARCNIAKGTRIICEKPLLTASSASSRSEVESDITTQVKSLPNCEQRLFRAFHNNFRGEVCCIGIMKTNALPCGPCSQTEAIYPRISLLNHSCLPNTHHSWNSALKCETIHAIYPISAGDELTINYSKPGPSTTRISQLQASFGFTCTCLICTLPPRILRQSDARRIQISTLSPAISDPIRITTDPEDCLADCHTMFRLLSEEYLNGTSPFLARLYYNAFHLCITHGDQARASVFAKRAYEARVVCEGGDSPETRRMKELMKKPAGHMTFGASQKWKTAKEMVPKGLVIDGFEGWLWRKGK